MSTKKERLDAICGIIQTKVISNQEELLKELEDSGFSVTQATLSRDIKQLKVAKVHDGNGDYVYRLPEESISKQAQPEGKKKAEYRVFRKLGGGEDTTGLRHGNCLGHRLPCPQRDTGHHSRRRYDLGNPPQRCEPREGDCRFITFYIKGKN